MYRETEDVYSVSNKLAKVMLSCPDSKISEHWELLTDACLLLMKMWEQAEKDRFVLEKIRKLIEGEVK